MKEWYNKSCPGGNHDEDLGRIQTPRLVLDIVEDDVRKRRDLRNSFVSQGEARRGGHPREEEKYERLKWRHMV